MTTTPIRGAVWIAIVTLSLIITQSDSASQAYRRDPGHPQWHHGAFHDVKDSVRSEVRQMLHSRAEVYLTPVISNFPALSKHSTSWNSDY